MAKSKHDTCTITVYDYGKQVIIPETENEKRIKKILLEINIKSAETIDKMCERILNNKGAIEKNG